MHILSLVLWCIVHIKVYYGKSFYSKMEYSMYVDDDIMIYFLYSIDYVLIKNPGKYYYIK